MYGAMVLHDTSISSFPLIPKEGLHTMVKPAYAQLGAVVGNVCLWCVTPVLAADLAPNAVTEAEITVSLPVYILSIIGTASFTWVVAKYDNERIRKMDRLASQMERLLKERDK